MHMMSICTDCMRGSLRLLWRCKYSVTPRRCIAFSYICNLLSTSVYMYLSFPASQLLVLSQPALLADPVQVWYKVLKFIDYHPPPCSTSSSQGGSDPLLTMLQQYRESILALTLKPWHTDNKGRLMWTAPYWRDIWVSLTLLLYNMSCTYSYNSIISLVVYIYIYI